MSKPGEETHRTSGGFHAKWIPSAPASNRQIPKANIRTSWIAETCGDKNRRPSSLTANGVSITIESGKRGGCAGSGADWTLRSGALCQSLDARDRMASGANDQFTSNLYYNSSDDCERHSFWPRLWPLASSYCPSAVAKP